MNEPVKKTFFRKEYFLFLLPIFFILHGYTENYPLISFKDAMILLLQYLLATTVLVFLFYFVLKSWRKATVFVFLFLSFYFFFGSAHDAMKNLLHHSFLLKYIFIVPAAILLFAAFLTYLKKTRRGFNRFVKYLNLLMLVFVLIDIFQLALKSGKTDLDKASLPEGFINCDSCSKPDIYLIIADGYAGHHELKDVFNYNNEDFENELKKRGFHIVDSSKSNYNYTPFSMASFFSMNYLEGIEGRNQSKPDRQICYRLINKNPVIDFLGSQGYSIKNLSVFQVNQELPQAHSDFFLTGRKMMTAQTFVERVSRDIRFNLITRFKLKSELKRLKEAELKGIQTIYQKTKEEASLTSTKPRFVYAHLMMPHYPYFFDRNGNQNPLTDHTDVGYMKTDKYLDYLIYSNKKFLELIDHIFASSKTQPIILFMSDHGFREFANDTVEHRYHFMNLNAMYFPNKKYQGFYSGMSMVNQMRVLMNEQFGQRLSLLKDSTSFLTE